jgi:CHAT domain-containing protein/Tfp pilus assembly protein PilF
VIGLAELRRTDGEYATARALFERARQIQERTLPAGSPQLAVGMAQYADFLQSVGDYAAARPLFERALRILEARDPRSVHVGATLNNYALLLGATGDAARARAAFERAVGILERALGPSHSHVALSLTDFGAFLRDQGDAPGARRLFERAVRIQEGAVGRDHPWLALGFVNLAEVTPGPGDRVLYERALPIARRSDPELRWRATVGLGRVRERDGRLDEALALYREAFQALESLVGQFGTDEGQRYLSSARRLEAYDALARLLLKLHDLDPGQAYARDAWAVLDAKKGRLIGGSLGNTRPTLPDASARNEVERTWTQRDRVAALERTLREEQLKPPEEQVATRLNSLTTLLAQTKAEYLAQVRTFLSRYPQYKLLFADQQTIDPKALAKFADRLPTGTLAVQYFAAPDALYLFVVAPGGAFQVKRQAVPQSELYALIHQYRQRLEAGEREVLPWRDDGSPVYQREVAPFKTLTETLSRHFLGPIGAELAAHRELIVVPNDLLLYLPFPALTHPDGSTRFLAETHAISYLTQLELVDVLTPARTGSVPSLLALANPDGSLPGASQEVRALRGVRSPVTVLEGPTATKARFLELAQQFPDIHLATHGILDPEQPERSYLLMAGAGPGPRGEGPGTPAGRGVVMVPTDAGSPHLTITDIAGLRLPAHALTVLSACDTAVGEQVPGAALVTLAAAFSQAGAQSIVASLWRVSDEATRDFMVTFHRTLLTSSRVNAIQHAQMALIANPGMAHPFYWAPFVLFGGR